MENRKIKKMAASAVIAALYTALTILLAPISSGLIQCRAAEALCVLPWYFPEAIPGLTIGCFLSSLFTGAALPDTLLGTIATFLAAVATRFLSKHTKKRFCAALPPVILNGFIVGALLAYVYRVGVPFPLCAAAVMAGEAVACFGIGFPLMLLLERRPGILRLSTLQYEKKEEGK